MRSLMKFVRKAWLMAGVTLCFLMVLEIASYFALKRMNARTAPSEESYWARSDSYAKELWVADCVAEFGRIRNMLKQPLEQQMGDILETCTSNQMIERDAANDQLAGLAIDMGELRFGGDDVFKSIFHHHVSPLRGE